MKRIDGRKLSHKTLEELRIRAVTQVEAGESPEVVIRALGFTRPRIYEWLAKYRDGGLDALRAKPVPGRPPKLTGSQLRWVYKTVVGKNPLQLRFLYALWTRGMVREVIRERFGVRLSEVSVGRMLKKLGLTPQKPLRRAYQQDPERVQQWIEKDYPKIKAMAKKDGAVVLFGDEAGVRSDYHAGTTWAPRGNTPVVHTTGARFGLNLISAVSPRGELRFMIVKGRMTAAKFIDFLKRLLHGFDRPIYLIVDGHPTHRAQKVKKFVHATEGRLHLFYLPPYSPELNPDELVWRNLKVHGIGRSAITGPAQLKRVVLGHLRSLQKRVETVRALFRDPHVRYAA
jgi:transposase